MRRGSWRSLGPAAGASPAREPRFALLLVLVGLLAFAIREHFVLTAIVVVPIRGDIREYVAYAWNLVHHGVFSHTFPQVAPPNADDYRSPGYPWLLALCMSLLPQGTDWAPLRGWYPLAQQMQVLLGTASALLVSLLARQWLAPIWAILSGLLLALWPHHIAATGALMPEVLFGFTLIAGLYCFARGWSGRRSMWFVATGAAFGYAYLVNPLVALFPPYLALALWLKRERVGAVILLCVYLSPVAALGMRNVQLDDPSNGSAVGRARINFVQGSWPQYHDAHRTLNTGLPAAIAVMNEIDRETQLLQQTPARGLGAIATRLVNDPWGYAAWYALRKPKLLWDWDIRWGEGVYVLDVQRSPLDTSPVLRGWGGALRAVNPLLTLLTLASAIALLLLAWRRDTWVPAAATGALAAYVTLVHVLLQAEPRYATAYRGIEVLLVMTALATLAHLATRFQKPPRPSTLSGPMGNTSQECATSRLTRGSTQ